MIVDKILDILASVVIFIIDLFPTWTFPTWWTSAITGWSSIVAGISDLAHWMPLDAIFQVAGAVFIVSIFSFSVRILRIVLSLFSGGGGSAA